VIDAQAAQTDSASTRDKRTLVLFLLGLALLSGHWLPVGQRPTIQPYGVAIEEKSGQWRVVSDPATTATGGESNSRVVSFLPKQGVAGNFPAKLSLFINRPVPINRADQAVLEMLPGIGPRLAAAIIKTSQQTGQFAGPKDLLMVPGIGPGIMQRLAPLVTFEQ